MYLSNENLKLTQNRARVCYMLMIHNPGCPLASSGGSLLKGPGFIPRAADLIGSKTRSGHSTEKLF